LAGDPDLEPVSIVFAGDMVVALSSAVAVSGSPSGELGLYFFLGLSALGSACFRFFVSAPFPFRQSFSSFPADSGKTTVLAPLDTVSHGEDGKSKFSAPSSSSPTEEETTASG